MILAYNNSDFEVLSAGKLIVFDFVGTYDFVSADSYFLYKFPFPLSGTISTIPFPARQGYQSLEILCSPFARPLPTRANTNSSAATIRYTGPNKILHIAANSLADLSHEPLL
jgi:hypothetical protein